MHRLLPAFYGCQQMRRHPPHMCTFLDRHKSCHHVHLKLVMGCCRNAREGDGQPESLIDLDGCEGSEVDADSAAAFAQQLLADKVRRSAQQSAIVSTAERPHHSQRAVTDGICLSTAAASSDEPHVSVGLRHPREHQEAQTSGSSYSLSTSGADSLVGGAVDDLAEYVVGDSEEDDDLAQPDSDKERQLLSRGEATAVANAPSSPPPPLHCSQRRHGSSHAADDKENVLWQRLPVNHAAKHMSWQSAERQHRARGQQAQHPRIADELHSSGRPDDSAGQGQPASQPGKKQLRRLYDAPGSEQAPGQASGALTWQEPEEDIELRDSYFLECNNAEGAIKLTDLRYRAMGDELRQQACCQIDGGEYNLPTVILSASEEEKNAAGASLPGDTEQELRTNSTGNGCFPDSWPGDIHARKTKHDTMQPAVSTGSAQHTIGGWDSRTPRSSASGCHKRSVSPETSQHRLCSQVCLTTGWCSDLPCSILASFAHMRIYAYQQTWDMDVYFASRCVQRDRLLHAHA